jgi:hypothetical protein
MNHQIVPTRPLWHVWLIRIGMLVLIGLFAWGMYEYGRYEGGYRFLEGQAAQQELRKQIAGLEKELALMREQNTLLTSSAKVDSEANRLLEATINGLRDERMELKRELDFYRGIVSPSDSSRGLNVQRLELNAHSEGGFQYSLVLTQVLDNSSIVEGSVEFVVEGTENGESREYSLAKLSDREGDLAFRFRYFEFLEGHLHLPKGFVPKQINLNIKPKGKTYKPFSRSFDWVIRES